MPSSRPRRLPSTAESFLVRGQPAVTKEGEDFPRNVVIEFPSHEVALACYDSATYKPRR